MRIGSVGFYGYNQNLSRIYWLELIEKQMRQATADDIEFQNQLGGLVIAHEIEDALAYTQAHCQMVADHELAVVMAQRRRVAFTKVAHLADEIGDMIQVVHPISGHVIKTYIAKLTRTFIRPAAGSEGGRFDDQIEGWRITS